MFVMVLPWHLAVMVQAPFVKERIDAVHWPFRSVIVFSIVTVSTKGPRFVCTVTWKLPSAIPTLDLTVTVTVQAEVPEAVG
jgi:hypothetical protein